MKSSIVSFGVCLLVIFSILPAYKAPPGCVHLKEDEDVNLCYHAVVDNNAETYCGKSCGKVLVPLLECAGNNTWSDQGERLKSLDESCATDKVEGAAAAVGATVSATILMALAAVFN